MATLHTPDPDLDRAFALACRRGEELLGSAEATAPAGELIALAAALLAAGVRAPARALLRALEAAPQVSSEVERSALRRAIAAWAENEGADTGAPLATQAGAPGADRQPVAPALARFLQPHAPADATATSALLDAVSLGLWGLEAHAPSGAIVVRPHLPEEWGRMEYRRLRVGSGILDLEIRRRRADLIARVHRVGGPPTVITLEPEPAPAGPAVVDDVELAPGRARFEATGRHEVVFRGAPG